MYLSDLLAGLGRRWYVLALGLIATAALCVGATILVPVDHVAKSSVLLLPPKSTVGTGGNPYLALGGLQAAADVLARAMTDGATVKEIAPLTGTASYTVQPDATTHGPMLVIEATDVSGAGAVATLDAILRRAPVVLHDLQSGVGAPTDSLIGLYPITHDVVADTVSKSQIRAVILAGVVGAALTLFGTTLLDAFLLRRGGGRRGRRTLASSSVTKPAAARPDDLADGLASDRDGDGTGVARALAPLGD